MKNINMEVVTCYHQSAMAQITAVLQADGFTIIPFDGATIVDKASFLVQAVQDLPLDEGCQPRGWDGFVDCLWGGLYHLPAERVALLWSSAHVLLEQDLQTFLTVNRLLNHVARSVGTTENGFSHKMRLVTFLLGDSTLFPMLTLDD